MDFTQTADGDGPPYGGEEDPQGIIQQTVGTQRFGFDVNADGTVNAHGFAVGLEYVLDRGFVVGGNAAFNQLLDQQDLIDTGFSRFVQYSAVALQPENSQPQGDRQLRL